MNIEYGKNEFSSKNRFSIITFIAKLIWQMSVFSQNKQIPLRIEIGTRALISWGIALVVRRIGLTKSTVVNNFLALSIWM